MKTTSFALVVGCTTAFLLPGAAGGCGGVTALLPADGGTDGQASSGSSSGGTGSGSSSSSTSSSSGGTSGSSSTSSSSGGTSGSSSGGTSGSSSSSSGGTSGSSSGISSSSSSGGSSSGGPDTGTIYFEQCSGSGELCQSPTFDFFAGFGQASGGNQGCTVTSSGECASYSCTGTTTNPVGVSAGTLLISGGSIGSGVTVSPDSSNNYDYEASGTLFAAGESLTVSATGATVPAFGPISVVAPGLPVLTAPGATSGTYTIPTTADLRVAWTGGSANGQVIFEGASDDSTNYFTCVWTASAGQGTVPQAMLTPLAGQMTGYLVYGQYTSTSFSAGAYSMSAAALPYSGASASFE